MPTKELSWDEFLIEYKPIINPFRDFTSMDGYLFETHGTEYECISIVKLINESNIWTYIDVDGVDILVNGYHYVNRLGYVITEIPADEGTHIQITNDD